jgi:putative zinc finger protein
MTTRDDGHLSIETLGDYADGVLGTPERGAAATHLEACPSCRRELERVREVIAMAAAMPASVAPDADLWPGVRAEIERRRVVPLGAAHGAEAGNAETGERVGSIWSVRFVAGWTRRERVLLAVAAVLLVVATSALAAIARDRRGNGTQMARGPEAPGAVAGTAPVALPVAYRAIEADYQRTIAELRASLDAQRGALSPATIATVDRSLRIIDDAIAEARTALANDPGNRALVDMLTAGYEQKVDLLRRAAEHTSKI